MKALSSLTENGRATLGAVSESVLNWARAYNLSAEDALALLCADIGCFPTGMVDEREARQEERGDYC